METITLDQVEVVLPKNIHLIDGSDPQTALAELIEMLNTTNGLVRLARALV
jgi:hypothetical protein